MKGIAFLLATLVAAVSAGQSYMASYEAPRKHVEMPKISLPPPQIPKMTPQYGFGFDQKFQRVESLTPESSQGISTPTKIHIQHGSDVLENVAPASSQGMGAPTQIHFQHGSEGMENVAAAGRPAVSTPSRISIQNGVDTLENVASFGRPAVSAPARINAQHAVDTLEHVASFGRPAVSTPARFTAQHAADNLENVAAFGRPAVSAPSKISIQHGIDMLENVASAGRPEASAPSRAPRPQEAAEGIENVASFGRPAVSTPRVRPQQGAGTLENVASFGRPALATPSRGRIPLAPQGVENVASAGRPSFPSPSRVRTQPGSPGLEDVGRTTSRPPPIPGPTSVSLNIQESPESQRPAGAPLIQSEVPITLQVERSDFKGNYDSEYKAADGTVRSDQGRMAVDEEGNDIHVKSGHTYYLAPEGTHFRLSYTADQHGYHPVGDHLPTPPPTPEVILEMLKTLPKLKETPEETSLPFSSKAPKRPTESEIASPVAREQGRPFTSLPAKRFPASETIENVFQVTSPHLKPSAEYYAPASAPAPAYTPSYPSYPEASSPQMKPMPTSRPPFVSQTISAPAPPVHHFGSPTISAPLVPIVIGPPAAPLRKTPGGHFDADGFRMAVRHTVADRLRL